MSNIATNRVKRILTWTAIIAVFLLLSTFFSALSTVHGKSIPDSYFAYDMPVIIGLLDSEFFMGIIFVVTVSVVVYIIYLLWHLHEIAVHKAEKIRSKQANLVFALSLCGLFLHKAWWVLAVIIAFTDWAAISVGLSAVISRGLTNSKEESKK